MVGTRQTYLPPNVMQFDNQVCVYMKSSDASLSVGLDQKTFYKKNQIDLSVWKQVEKMQAGQIIIWLNGIHNLVSCETYCDIARGTGPQPNPDS